MIIANLVSQVQVYVFVDVHCTEKNKHINSV